MLRKTKRVAVAFVAVDLIAGLVILVGVRPNLSAGRFHASAPRMSAQRLEQLLSAPGVSRQRTHAGSVSANRYSCLRDPNGAWDYYCTGINGVEAFYDVSATGITASTVIRNAVRSIGRPGGASPATR